MLPSLLPASVRLSSCSSFFFFNDPATTDIYTLSLHDALPISLRQADAFYRMLAFRCFEATSLAQLRVFPTKRKRSEEHTSELQSLTNLVCRLLLEKKKNK